MGVGGGKKARGEIRWNGKQDFYIYKPWLPKLIYLESVVICAPSYEMLDNLIEPASHTTWPTDNKLPLEVNWDFLDQFGSLRGWGSGVLGKTRVEEKGEKTGHGCQQKRNNE